MRKKIVATLAVGTIGLSGLALAAPALASPRTASSHSTETPKTPRAPKADALKTALAGLVTDQTLTQAQADKVASTLTAAGIGRGGPGGRPGGEDGPGHGGPGREGHDGPGGDLSTAATALGVSEADLRTALESGQTLAQVAQAHNVTVDALVAALVKVETTRITKQVTDGQLTQAEADKRLAGLTARITERVNSVRPARPAAPKTKTKTKDQAPTPPTTTSPTPATTS